MPSPRARPRRRSMPMRPAHCASRSTSMRAAWRSASSPPSPSCSPCSGRKNSWCRCCSAFSSPIPSIRWCCWLERLHIQRAIGATLVTVAMLVALARHDVPGAGRVLQHHRRAAARSPRRSPSCCASTGGQPSTIPQVQAAADRDRTGHRQRRRAEDKRARRAGAPRPAAGAGSSFKVMDWVLAGSMGLVGFVTQATMVVFLVFFLLLAGRHLQAQAGQADRAVADAKKSRCTSWTTSTPRSRTTCSCCW